MYCVLGYVANYDKLNSRHWTPLLFFGACRPREGSGTIIWRTSHTMSKRDYSIILDSMFLQSMEEEARGKGIGAALKSEE